ncbi:MAG: hypothetical protein CMJ78_16680 [Planctomycetaceae bacterium]|nr:hypothetical protein [Planctomycetaceae bacterium]
MRTNFQKTAESLMARELAGDPLHSIFRSKCRSIYRQLSIDARCPAMLSLWGTSLNFDENAKCQIVSPWNHGHDW